MTRTFLLATRPEIVVTETNKNLEYIHRNISCMRKHNHEKVISSADILIKATTYFVIKLLKSNNTAY